jgi:polar amino acid transport system substrate-binding protein
MTSKNISLVHAGLGVSCARQTFTDADVMELVNTTAANIERKSSETFRYINSGEAPYRNAENPDLYVFVYDTNFTMMAHGDSILRVGVNYHGKTDVTGKPFHDEIVTGALSDETG